jgi:hypothetical protein
MKPLDELKELEKDAWSWYEATGDDRDVAAITSMAVVLAERIDALLETVSEDIVQRRDKPNS